jgi:DNA topoisomerase-2
MLETMVIGTSVTKEDGTAGLAIVKDFKENHTDTTVLFTVTLPQDKMAESLQDKGGLVKRFKLESSIATSNMHMFDFSGQIRKFER